MRFFLSILVIAVIVIEAESVLCTDTIRYVDTVVTYDTVYMFDTTVAVQKQLGDIRSDFYQRAIESIEAKKSTANVLLTIAGVVLAVITILYGFLAYRTYRSRNFADIELEKVRSRREDVEKLYDDLLLRNRMIKQKISDLDLIMQQQQVSRVKEPDKKKEDKGISIKKKPDDLVESRFVTEHFDRFKLINESDAEKSTEEYEKLVFAIELSGIPLDKLPDSLLKNVVKNYMRLENYDRALQVLLLYLKRNDNDVEAHVDAGLCYGQSNKLEEAAHEFQHAVKINPKSESALINWGVALSNLSDIRPDAKESLLEEAIEKYKRATDINDRNDITFYNWGNALGKLSDVRPDIKEKLLEETIEKYERATEINNLNNNAWSNWGVALIKLFHVTINVGLLHEAAEKCRKAIDINSEESNNWFNLACVRALLKQKQPMLDALGKAVELDSGRKKEAREDEDFKNYWGDPDFIELTKEDAEKE